MAVALPIPVPLPPGVPGGIRVWRLALRLDEPPPARDWALLAPAEVERAQRLRQPADRVRAVCTRAALRRLLGERLGVVASLVPLETGSHGRPRLAAEAGGRRSPEGPVLDFNVSHSGACALIALSDGGLSVGVDVEECDAAAGHHAPPGEDPAERAEGDDARALEALVLSLREQAAGAAARPGFRTLWTAKEAVLKCLGLGVAEHLRAVSLKWPLESLHGGMPPGAAGGAGSAESAESAGGLVAVRLEAPLDGRKTVHACRLPMPPGHVAGLAWSSDRDEIRGAFNAPGMPLAPPWAGASEFHGTLHPS